MIRVHIVATGVANTASVCAAFHRLGCEPVFVERFEEVRDATHLVVPGVGAFGAAMARLRERDWVEPLVHRIRDGRPTFAICLGLQLLGAGSSESPGDPGLACVPEVAAPFARGTRTPHMGWNQVRADSECRLLESGAAYFAHSYCWGGVPDGWAGARTEHAEPFVSAIEREAVVACQFHPELSGDYGADLMRRWLRAGGASC